MKLYLMQHGRPVPEEMDPERPLSDQGKSEVAKVGDFLRQCKVQVGQIFHSGKIRAKQTADIVAAKLGSQVKVEERNGLAPMDDVGDMSREINASMKDLLIIGHLPHLSKLVSLLVTGSEASFLVCFQQSGIVCLEKEEKGKWVIAWMVVPQIL